MLKLKKLESVVKQQNMLRNLWDNFTSVKKASIASNSKAAGFCLMIVLLSFGLFFNNMAFSGNRLAPMIAPIKVVDQPIIEPAMEPIVETIPMDLSSNEMVPRRKLLQVESVPVQKPSIQIPQTIVESNHKEYARHDKTPAKTSENRSFVRSEDSHASFSAETINDKTNEVISFGKNIPQIDTKTPVKTENPVETQDSAPQNVTYVVCNDAQVMAPPEGKKDGSTEYLAVLVPPSSMGVEAPPGVMLQLMCKLLHFSLTSVSVQV